MPTFQTSVDTQPFGYGSKLVPLTDEQKELRSVLGNEPFLYRMLSMAVSAVGFQLSSLSIVATSRTYRQCLAGLLPQRLPPSVRLRLGLIYSAVILSYAPPVLLYFRYKGQIDELILPRHKAVFHHTQL